MRGAERPKIGDTYASRYCRGEFRSRSSEISKNTPYMLSSGVEGRFSGEFSSRDGAYVELGDSDHVEGVDCGNWASALSSAVSPSAIFGREISSAHTGIGSICNRN